MMRYYIICGNCNSKFYVNSNAKTRADLPSFFSLSCPICKQIHYYYPNDVLAETSVLGSAGGALLGGLLGLTTGGAGAVIGAIVGAALGGGGEKADNDAMERFNES